MVGVAPPETRPPARARMRLSAWRALAVAPAVLVLGAWLAWVPAGGGYFPRDWYPPAIAGVGLLLVVGAVGGRALPRSRAAIGTLVLLLGLVLWSFASLEWSASPGGGWEASNKLALYALVAWILALLPWTGRSALAFATAWGLGTAGLLGLELAQFAGSEDPAAFLASDRYTDGVGYTNATAALAAVALWPALVASARRDVPWMIQAPALLAAAFLAQYALLPQSRTTMAATLAMVPIALALAPDRLRLLARLAVVGGVVALSVEPVFAVYKTAAVDGPLVAAVDTATSTIVRGVLLAGAASLVLALVERFVRPGPRLMGAVRATVALGVVAAALGGLGLAATNAGAIRADLDDRWQTFKSSDPVPQTTANRLSARYSDKRYDYWRVSMAMWREAPVRGAGAGSFEPVYASEKRHGRHARFPHDVWLRTLGETGLVGLGLLGGALIALVGGLLVAYRRADSAARAVTAMALAAGGYVLLHASLDFLEEFPVIVAPALGLAVVALVAATARARPSVDAAGPREGGDLQGPAEPGGEGPPARPSRGRRAAGGLGAAAGCLLLAAFLASLVAPYLSHRWVERAQATWREDRPGAVRDLERAARVNPWSDDPHVTLGTIALVVGDERAARVGFARALRVERSWYPYFQLGLLDAQGGKFARAERRLARASLLNRDDDLIAAAREDVAARKRIDALAFTRRALRTSLDNAGGVG